MATFVESLPPRKASKHSGIKWTPTESTNVPPDRLPGAGELVIDTDRSRVTYSVTEFPTPWEGRGFFLAKLRGSGTDSSESSYSVFVARNRQDMRCDCKGFTRHGHCEHCDAVIALLSNDWL